MGWEGTVGVHRYSWTNTVEASPSKQMIFCPHLGLADMVSEIEKIFGAIYVTVCAGSTWTWGLISPIWECMYSSLLQLSTCHYCLPRWIFRLELDSHFPFLLTFWRFSLKNFSEYDHFLKNLFIFNWRVMLKILQARLQQYVNHELPDVQARFRKGRGTRDQVANISAGSLKKQESSRKTSISALLTMPQPLTVWITINCGKFWKRWAYQTIWPASWETCMQVRKQQLELDMEQQTGSK